MPHHVSYSWRRRDDGGGGVVAKPDRLVAFQTLSSERVQQVHLSLSDMTKKLHVYENRQLSRYFSYCYSETKTLCVYHFLSCLPFAGPHFLTEECSPSKTRRFLKISELFMKRCCTNSPGWEYQRNCTASWGLESGWHPHRQRSSCQRGSCERSGKSLLSDWLSIS